MANLIKTYPKALAEIYVAIIDFFIQLAQEFGADYSVIQTSITQLHLQSYAYFNQLTFFHLTQQKKSISTFSVVQITSN